MGRQRGLIEAWVNGDGSLAARLMQIGVKEERSKWRERVRRETRRKNSEIIKKQCEHTNRKKKKKNYLSATVHSQK